MTAMESLQLASHVYAIRCSGFTRIAAQITGPWLDELRGLADSAVAVAREVYRAKGKLRHTAFNRAWPVFLLGPAFRAQAAFSV